MIDLDISPFHKLLHDVFLPGVFLPIILGAVVTIRFREVVTLG
jgi:hypothetical protein